jgi:hypothetical protein
MDGFDDTADANFALGTRSVGGGGVGNRRGRAGAGGHEEKGDRG